MSLFASVIRVFPPFLWEQNGLETHTLMLLQVSKEMVEAVCYDGRTALPAHVYVKPSQVRLCEELRWYRVMCKKLDLTQVNLLVMFRRETDTAGYLMTAENVIGALKYMTDVKTLDLSALKVIMATEHEVDKNNDDVEVYWTEDRDAYVTFGKDAFLQTDFMPIRMADEFIHELTRNCICLEELRLNAAMRNVVVCAWDDWEYWAWLQKLSNLRTLSLEDMEIDSSIAYDVLTAVMNCTALTELNLDGNPMGYMNNILTADPPDNLNLQSLGLSGCGLGGWDDTDEDMQRVSVKGVLRLLNEVTSLTELNLGSNQFSDIHGRGIANALHTITSLTKLDLRYNYITVDVREQIRAAWQPRTADTLLLDVDDDSDMEDAQSSD